MPAIRTLKQSILAECDEDHVGLWAIIRDAEDVFPKHTERALRDEVLKLLSDLLVTHEITAGFPTPEGSFRSLQATTKEIIARIESEWPVGRRPDIGEGLWFTKSNKRGD